MTLEKYEYDTYFEELRDSLKSCEGDYKEIVLKIPDFLDLFVELLRETERIGKEERRMINAAIGYTLAPYDVNPEKSKKEEDKIGLLKRIPYWAKKQGTKTRRTEEYIDDAYICAEILSRLKTSLDKDLIKSKWEGEENIFELVEEINEKLGEKLDKGTREAIIEYSGLDK